MMRRATILLVVMAFGVTGLSANAYRRPAQILLVSAATGGAPGNQGSGYQLGATGYGTSTAAMTPDARYVAFSSVATNFAAGNPAGVPQIYVRDLRTGRTRQASLTSAGKPAELTKTESASKKWGSYDPSISANGRYVAFWSFDQNLAPTPAGPATTLADLHNQMDVFVHDMLTGATERVSVNGHGTAASASSLGPYISEDGRSVAFVSQALDLLPGQCGVTDLIGQCIEQGNLEVYVRDLRKHATQMASVFRSGEAATSNASTNPSLSGDGRYVVFGSTGSDLTADKPAAEPGPFVVPTQTYVRDLKTQRTSLVSVGLDGLPGNDQSGPNGNSGNAYSTWQAITADGRYVAFMSKATNLIPYNPPEGGMALYVRDLVLGRTQCVSVLSTGEPILDSYARPVAGLQYASLNDGPHISDNGRFVGFSMWGDETTRDYSGNEHFYGIGSVEYDRVTGGLDILEMPTKLNPDGQPSYGAMSAISADGRYTAVSTNDAYLPGNRAGGKYYQVYRLDHGRTLGVGGLVDSSRLSVAGSATFATTGMLRRAEAGSPPTASIADLGGSLGAASISYRPGREDMFVRLELDRMPRVTAAPWPVEYGLDLETERGSYVVRVSKLGPTPTFELYRWSGSSGWTAVASLAGGFGTTGQEVTFAVPLASLGAQSGARLEQVSAWAALAGDVGGRVSEIRMAP